MIIEWMHINHFDKGCDLSIYNYDEDDDNNNNNNNAKVENISNAEAARIMKSKLGKASSHQTTEVATQW